MSATTAPLASARPASKTALPILFAVSGGHLLNDTIQSLLPAVYPLLGQELNLSLGQVGLITLAFQLTASILQPIVGLYTDKHPQPYSLAAGMVLTLTGVVLLSLSHSLGMAMVAAAFIGLGSSIFHPEASRVARLASGGRHGFAQSLFQVGGNAGSALGPLLAAAVLVQGAQSRIAWFTVLPVIGCVLLGRVGRWYGAHLLETRRAGSAATAARPTLSRNRIVATIAVLMVLIFSKYFYLACLTNYFTFYLIDRFAVSVQNAQLLLFVFLGAVALGTFFGGPLGDRIGRKRVIWFSILGVAPFALALPHAGLVGCVLLSACAGFILASAFSAIVVYAQELIPGRPGLVAGMFFGFAFGMGGIGAAALGALADRTSIGFVFRACSFLPLLGLLTVFLPEVERRRTANPTKL